MSYYLAVDQGGTKTQAIVFTDTGDIIAYGDDLDIRSIHENYVADQGSFLQLATQNALTQAHLTTHDISSACCALNGADWVHEYERLRILASTSIGLDAANITIINDCIGAMRGGTDDKNCAVLCIGTGLNCAIRNRFGQEYIYGYFIADCDQGGSALGSAAWRAVIDSENGLGEKTSLTSMMLTKYGKENVEELYIAITEHEITFAPKHLSPLLMRAAELGDPVALSIIHHMGERLAMYVIRGMERLSLVGERLTLVLSGGVLKGSGHILSNCIREKLASMNGLITCVDAQYEPVAGTALIQLDEKYHGCIPPAVQKRFQKSAQVMSLLRNREGYIE